MPIKFWRDHESAGVTINLADVTTTASEVQRFWTLPMSDHEYLGVTMKFVVTYSLVDLALNVGK